MSVLAIAFLLLSLAFAAYLYPLPHQNIAQMTSSMTSAERAQVSESLEASYWASWATNLVLMFLGLCSATLWLVRGRKGSRTWLAVTAAGCFFVICAVVLLLQTNGDGIVVNKIALVRQLGSTGASPYVAAEVHRLLSMFVALAMSIAMSLSLRGRSSA
jgi:hypothetical protein